MAAKIIKTLASLKLAVGIILILVISIATGTIVESKYNSAIATKLVYHTWWMFLVLGTLSLSLIAVMIDRWPWKKRHSPFILAHIGIITLLFGALLTMNFGLDASLRVALHGNNRWLSTNKTSFEIVEENSGKIIFQSESDFYLQNPATHPVKIDSNIGVWKITDYVPFGIPEQKIIQSPEGFPALHFQMGNGNSSASESDWLVTSSDSSNVEKNLGPVKIRMLNYSEAEKPQSEGHEIWLKVSSDSPIIKYKIFNSKAQLTTGMTEEGGVIKTPWMNLELKILRFLPKAEQIWEIKAQTKPTELTTEAVKVEFGDQKKWLALGDSLKFKKSDQEFLVKYSRKLLDLGFALGLRNFEVGKHPGLNKAKSFESTVEVEDNETYSISMNEPLKYKGFTIYQSSFQSDPISGAPIASLFSVNRDPGRWLKYLGSLLIVCGVILLFYQKRGKFKS